MLAPRSARTGATRTDSPSGARAAAAPQSPDRLQQVQQAVGNAALMRLLRGRLDRAGAPRAAVEEERSGEAARLVSQTLSGSGEALDESARSVLEPRFNTSFADVRVHTGATASASARSVQARAYTVGRDVAFGAGEYQPRSQAGLRLIAHELVHVIQQRGQSGQGGAALHRDEQPAGASPEGAGGGASGSLLAIAEALQRVLDREKAGASEEEGGESVAEHLETLGRTIEQVKAVAAGDDEEEKARVLAGFQRPSVERAESELTARPELTGESPAEGLARSPLRISAPTDAAEIEAERIADQVISGAPAASVSEHRAGALNRQIGEALVAAGVGTLTVEAEASPVVGGTGPPGWVVGGLVALGALALIGTGYILMTAAGNVADTGIMQEAQAMVAAGKATDICDALQKLLDATSDSQRKRKIISTQKAKGCRHSRHS